MSVYFVQESDKKEAVYNSRKTLSKP